MPRASSDSAVGLDRLLELLGQIDEGSTLKRQEVKAISLECTALPHEQARTSARAGRATCLSPPLRT